MKRHAITHDAFLKLASGGGGAEGVRLLARAQRSKHLLLLRHVVSEAERAGHDHARPMAAALDLLAGLHADDPAAVEPVLRHPPVATWALRMRRTVTAPVGNPGGAPAALAYLPAMAAAAAVRAGATCTVDLLAPAGRVILPTLGQARLAGADRRRTARARLTCGRDGAEIGHGRSRIEVTPGPGYADGWSGLRLISARAEGREFALLVDDLDPFRLPHLMRGGMAAGRQSQRDMTTWQEELEKAWQLLVTHHPGVAEELPEALAVLVPVRGYWGGWVSATSRHAFGQVALSPQPDAETLACAFTHELQHAKLSALLDLVPLLGEGGNGLWYAPWREDPRPLSGLLQGAYAHLAVAAFWRVQRFADDGVAAMRGHAEYARWRRGTFEAIEALRSSGTLTEAGGILVDRMTAVMDGWTADEIPADARSSAGAAAERHRDAWLRRNR